MNRTMILFLRCCSMMMTITAANAATTNNIATASTEASVKAKENSVEECIRNVKKDHHRELDFVRNVLSGSSKDIVDSVSFGKTDTAFVLPVVSSETIYDEEVAGKTKILRMSMTSNNNEEIEKIVWKEQKKWTKVTKKGKKQYKGYSYYGSRHGYNYNYYDGKKKAKYHNYYYYGKNSKNKHDDHRPIPEPSPTTQWQPIVPPSFTQPTLRPTNSNPIGLITTTLEPITSEPSATFAPTSGLPTAQAPEDDTRVINCVDDESFRYRGTTNRSCVKWVANSSEERCSMQCYTENGAKNRCTSSDETFDPNKLTVAEYCPETCNLEQCASSMIENHSDDIAVMNDAASADDIIIEKITDSPTAATPPKEETQTINCVDDESFRYRGSTNRSCFKWVANSIEERCGMRCYTENGSKNRCTSSDETFDPDKLTVAEYCPETCNLEQCASTSVIDDDASAKDNVVSSLTRTAVKLMRFNGDYVI